jgi:hypothetical protein
MSHLIFETIGIITSLVLSIYFCARLLVHIIDDSVKVAKVITMRDYKFKHRKKRQ